MKEANDPKETNGKPQPATNDPEEAIDMPEKVEESNDEKIDEDFPGYPHYPAKDDILTPGNYTERVDLDIENITRSHTISQQHIKSLEGTQKVNFNITQDSIMDDEGIELPIATDADVTAEDLALLGPKDQDMDMDEDEELRLRGWEPVTGKDLDVPDAELEDEAIGQEDEENSYYSLGGDEKEHLRENDDQNNF